MAGRAARGLFPICRCVYRVRGQVSGRGGGDSSMLSLLHNGAGNQDVRSTREIA